MVKVVTNPKTGKMETIEDTSTVTKEDLAKLHKEVRDMLDGNVQFHVDPFTPVVPDEEPPDEDEYYVPIY